jgi:aminoglycoside 3-N-acetyltransferase
VVKKIDRHQIASELSDLGIRQGDVVMIHSSLSALGPVNGGAETVVDALLDSVGPSGTLLVPAFRDSVWGSPGDFANTDCSCLQEWCRSQQPGFQGAIPEAVRSRAGSLRSCHPTHSWVALGPASQAILRGHRDSLTPCGRGSPFESLISNDGCILTLGVGVDRVTFWHYYEEVLNVPYVGHYWPVQRHLNHCVTGRRIQYEFPGLVQDISRQSGILKTGPVGKSTSGLMRARVFDAFLATIMTDDPYCLVLRPPTRDCGDLGVDALQKAARMLLAWAGGSRRVEPALVRRQSDFNNPLGPIKAPGPGSVVREDCPAFAGFHQFQEKRVPLCKANDRHPEYFRLGGIFNQYGLATCERCSWHRKFSRSL